MNNIRIIGLWSGAVAHDIAKKINDEKVKGNIAIVVANDDKANDMADSLSFFVSKKINIFRTKNEYVSNYDAKSRYDLYNRNSLLFNSIHSDNEVYIIPATEIIQDLPVPDVIKSESIHIKRNQEIDIDDFLNCLVKLGYKRELNVFDKGQFAKRGSIVDIYPINSDYPVRIELFDILVEDIRYFDIESQRSTEKIEFVSIAPATIILDIANSFQKAKNQIDEIYKKYNLDESFIKELFDNIDYRDNIHKLELYIKYFYDNLVNVFEYIRPTNIYVDDLKRINESLTVNQDETIRYIQRELNDNPYLSYLIKNENYIDLLSSILMGTSGNKGIVKKVFYTPFNDTFKNYKFESVEEYQSGNIPQFNGDISKLKSYILEEINDDNIIYFSLDTEQDKKNLQEYFNRENIPSSHIQYIASGLNRGFVDLSNNSIYITSNDVFNRNRSNHLYKKRKRTYNAIESIIEINAGDYVVHDIHGIGQFISVEPMEIDGIKKDHIKIKYSGSGILYVPVENMDMVQKYIGKDGVVPRLHSLSGKSWENTKNKIKESIYDMAKEILDVSAKRQREGGYAFSKDSIWQRQFEDAFMYEPTVDQKNAIDDTKRDMEKPVSMDRLICGDVGVGKTEVAARAIFKAISDDKQVIMLAPTTILANQHYNTLRKRIEGFPFSVEMLSRFVRPKKQKEIIKDFEEGMVDVLVGTHRVLSEDVKFKDLGLLIIDEEQRFGVKDKEKIKKLKANVDVLALSATPIPRTLHMSLIGMRDVSIIKEPPVDRLPVQTYVLEENFDVIREAIERESARDGQVFILYNRVSDINLFAKKISNLVPEKTISIGHGQMNENRLEEIMMDFIDGKSDILISTTIIESGIDIPRANTIIIMDADRFGLSQLYQLRGRVGRSNKLAYAYLMYKKNKAMNEIADKRLKAIKEFTKFGSGFKVAMRDLELRGAGNIIGKQQHGHMVSVGYELYCKMVDEAVATLKGEEIQNLNLNVNINILASAFIPDDYISDEATKISIYKEIAKIKNKDEANDIAEDLRDRFGAIPREVYNIIKLSIIKKLCIRIGFSEIEKRSDNIVYKFDDKGLLPVMVSRKKELDILDDIIEFLEFMI
ncbi:MAG: transcription-repair coupling factor [Eubacteriales bacterium]|nr:transcription-repair coupling factor [Eubacteriales bacterium]MDY3332909.1 transcription-repair coupling factor [Gallibacter sp.]